MREHFNENLCLPYREVEMERMSVKVNESNDSPLLAIRQLNSLWGMVEIYFSLDSKVLIRKTH